MSVIDRQVAIRIELTVSNAFNTSLLSKAASLATNDKTASIRDDDSDEHCPCEDIQIRFPIPDPWVYMFRVEKRFRYGAIHSVRRRAGKIKVSSRVAKRMLLWQRRNKNNVDDILARLEFDEKECSTEKVEHGSDDDHY